ncbi:hypothetical protein CTAYLR_006876 [Chrysophaeum taylorii]|uniref:EF-hand domain-containing protein n=1 Tax=Chrysophaeum taylorii TaxID=2483200 RepID=A0AAD7U710_9STRA|nr:hypothetical protein CTAYLR_006876 [Chrysophaeum taylorii]
MTTTTVGTTKEEPILAAERTKMGGGLWTTEKYGDLSQGDKRLAAAFVTGRVELRQLRGLYKIEFKELAVVYRRTGEDGTKAPLRARVYLTQKTAKKRMADLEETSYAVPVDGDGYVGNREATLGAFELSLRDAPVDPREYRGLVVAKPAREVPLTEEPAVYGYARFIDDRPEIPTTDNALGMNEYKDLLEKARKHAATLRGGQATTSHHHQWKSMSYYKRMARKAWEELDKVEEAEMDAEEFKRALDLLDVTMLEPRAIRLFEAADLDNSGFIGMTEFEVALMMHDGAPDAGLTPQDAFKMFDFEKKGTISRTAFPRAAASLEVAKTFPGKPESEERRRAMEALFDVVDKDGSGEISYAEFRSAWAQLVDVEFELRRRGIAPAKVPKFLRAFGLATRGAMAINRHALLRACADEESAERRAFEDARRLVDDLRESARRKRDEKRRARAAARDKLGSSAARDTALRNKERTARLRREQAARSRHREEEKVARNRLAAERALAKRRADAQLRARSAQKEEDRVREIRAAGLDRLEATFRDLRVVPREMFASLAARERLADVVWADFGDNRLEVLPSEGFLMWFASLRYLRLANNRLVSLPGAELGKMGKLQVLRLGRNELTELPSSIGELLELRELDASINRLATLPGAISNLRMLGSLDLASNHIAAVPNGALGPLFGLRTLSLRANRLFELPDDISEAVSLTTLDLHNNRLHALPEHIGDLVFLLSRNEIVGLGPWIGGWKRATLVDASFNKIARVDRAAGALRSLVDLRLRGNECVSLPPEVGLARQLQTFDCSANALATLPVELGALAHLHTVTLGRNSIAGLLPREIGLLRSATRLDLSYNKIEELPETVRGLQELIVLNLDHNRLETLPDAIFDCARLENLSVAANRLRALPAFGGGGPALRVLDLTSNLIEELPADIARLANITRIYLGKNRLRSLPIEMADLLDLADEVRLDRNPFSDLPPRWSCYDADLAIQWVRDHARFYREALEEWDATGPSTFDKLADDDAKLRATARRKADAIRDFRATKARRDSIFFHRLQEDLYHENLRPRIAVAETRFNLRRERTAALDSTDDTLLEEVHRRAILQDQREAHVEDIRLQEELLQLQALHQHLDTCGDPTDGTHFFLQLVASIPTATLLDTTNELR